MAETTKAAGQGKPEETAAAAAAVARLMLAERMRAVLPLKHHHLAQLDTEIMAARVVPEVLPFTLVAEVVALARLEEPQRLQITVEMEGTGKRSLYLAAAFITVAAVAVRYGVSVQQQAMVVLAEAEAVVRIKPPQGLAAGLH